MKFAIPTVNSELTAHFGHCEKFALIDTNDHTITNEEFVDPPPHQPGLYPKFLSEQGVNIIIAGGMGHRAQSLFSQFGIDVYVGVPGGNPRVLVEQYLKKELETGQNLCDH